MLGFRTSLFYLLYLVYMMIYNTTYCGVDLIVDTKCIVIVDLVLLILSPIRYLGGEIFHGFILMLGTKLCLYNFFQ